MPEMNETILPPQEPPPLGGEQKAIEPTALTYELFITCRETGITIRNGAIIRPEEMVGKTQEQQRMLLAERMAMTMGQLLTINNSTELLKPRTVMEERK